MKLLEKNLSEKEKSSTSSQTEADKLRKDLAAAESKLKSSNAENEAKLRDLKSQSERQLKELGTCLELVVAVTFLKVAGGFCEQNSDWKPRKRK